MTEQSQAAISDAPEEKRGRGREPGFRMPEEHRDKIRNSNILHRLVKCAEGELEMTAVQAQVGLGLIKKVLPDLSATTLEGGDPDKPVSFLQRVERAIVDANTKD